MPTNGNGGPLREPGAHLVVRGLDLVWGSRTYVMGVLNVTPDSFSGDGVADDLDAAAARARWLVDSGADILDVGGESTRPGAVAVPAADELARLLPVVRALRSQVDVPISVDTYKADVAEACLAAGADIVNDIWGMTRDRRMAAVVASAAVPVVLMDNCSDPARLQSSERLGQFYTDAAAGDPVTAVISRLSALVDEAVAAGIGDSRIIVDPGIGFGKSRAENLALMDRLDEIRALGYPVLVGPSRKSFIGLTLDARPDDRVEGTAATVAVAIARGVDLVRVHDVTVMTRVARMTDAIVRRPR